MKKNRFDKTFEKQVMALVKKALSPIKGTQKKNYDAAHHGQRQREKKHTDAVCTSQHYLPLPSPRSVHLSTSSTT